jgi:CRISPR-associated protein Cas2
VVVTGEVFMFVILVYDINTKRVAKALKICRQYLDWVQNSVFEGEITRGKLECLKSDLNQIIKKEDDSVLVYEFESMKYSGREVLGKEKSEVTNIL